MKRDENGVVKALSEENIALAFGRLRESRAVSI